MHFSFSVELVSDRGACDIDETFVQDLYSRRDRSGVALGFGQAAQNIREARSARVGTLGREATRIAHRTQMYRGNEVNQWLPKLCARYRDVLIVVTSA